MTKPEELNQMINKAIKGKNGYQCASCGQDGVKYLFDGQQGEVTSMALGIWDDNQIHVCQVWDKTKPVDMSKRFFAVSKDQEKFMVAVEKVGVFSFGAERDRKEKCKAILHVQCGCISTLVMAVNDPPMLVVHDYVQDETDPLSVILPDLLTHLLADYQRGEVASNAGSAGPTADVNLGE